MFVNFKGKKTLSINYYMGEEEKELDKQMKKNFKNFCTAINKKLEEYLGEELLDNLTPNFSTTNDDTSIIYNISVMAAFKKYFNYEMHLMNICGMPYIILEGTLEDYEKILIKAKGLRKYKFEWYIDRIIPHIQKMIEAKKGKVDYGFFRNIIKNETGTKFKRTGCSPNSIKVKVDYIEGWILDFFAYDQEGYRISGGYLKPNDIEKLTSQLLIVPFKVCYKNFIANLKYSVGFFGCDQNEKNEVIPVIGWTVSNCSEKEKNSIQ